MNIVLYGHPILKEKSSEVEDIDDSLRDTLNEMIKLMRKANGVGLAANQVGINKRFFVLEVDGLIKRIINPEILEFGDKITEYEEGCLSIPIKYKNENEEEVIEDLDGMWSRAFQHEFDHIEGILFVEKLSLIDKRLITKKLEILKRDFKKGRIHREDV